MYKYVLVIVSALYASSAWANTHESRKIQQCVNSGGTWINFVEGEAIPVREVICDLDELPGCDCGPTTCWDEKEKKCIQEKP